jgi:hypothetical protein
MIGQAHFRNVEHVFVTNPDSYENPLGFCKTLGYVVLEKDFFCKNGGLDKDQQLTKTKTKKFSFSFSQVFSPT